MSCGAKKDSSDSKTAEITQQISTEGNEPDGTVPDVIEKKETKTETKEIETDLITVDDTGELVIDDKNKDVTIEKTENGEGIATIKTKTGDEVKVAVKVDDTGKVTVDNTKTVETDSKTSETKVVENTPAVGNVASDKDRSITRIEVDDQGKVVVKTTETTNVTVKVTAAPTAMNTPAKVSDTSVPTQAVTKTPATNTPLPVNMPVNTPANVETPKPVATDIPTPKPASTSTPKPINIDTPVPTSTSTPKPTATNTPTATKIPKPTTTTAPAHTHNWVAVTKNVHHNEAGHWEYENKPYFVGIYYNGSYINTRPTIHSFYEALNILGMWSTARVNHAVLDQGDNYTDFTFDSSTRTADELNAMEDYYDCGSITTRTARTEIIEKWYNSWDELSKDLAFYKSEFGLDLSYVKDNCYTKTWVVDKAAYDETVITGYKCSCGATK